MDSSQDKFVEYYKDASLQQETTDRFRRIRDLVVPCLGRDRYENEKLKVADIGCGTGVQAVLWAEDGHEVFGLDINKGLISEARKRAEDRNLAIQFCLGSADRLPWKSDSMDVCLVPELLEHVGNWQECLDEFVRVLRPDGILYLSTTNRLCPKQQEFNLPLYSWYPARVKRYCEHLAVTTKPHWVEYAKYPAINWFDFYFLRREFEKRGLSALDRVDIYARNKSSRYKALASRLIAVLPPLRYCLQIATPYSQLVGLKKSGNITAT